MIDMTFTTTIPRDIIHIDGAAGEGGGQILRSSLALSMALGVPFRISNIRANREKPGLMRQHLTAVQAAVALSSARCEGAAVGSGELLFVPGPVRAGEHRFAIGTAGSTTLVLQAILPPLLFADGPSEIRIEGGTHTRWAPPFDFFERSLVPALRRFGVSIECTLERHGFYPAGGGAIRVRVVPTLAPRAVTLHERGAIVRRSAEVILAKIHFDIARRELAAVTSRLGWPTDHRDVRMVDDSTSPGNAVVLGIECENAQDLFCSIGEHRRSAEAVATEAADEARDYLEAGVPVGTHLADQLMVPMAIAVASGAGTCGFTSLPFSRHASSNSEIIATFLGRSPTVERLEGKRSRWEVASAGSA
jgi:RNA 3'-terminal phosphate cyclase (ATP)